MLGLVIVMYFYGDLINRYNSLQLEANRITTKVYQTNSALKTTLFTDDFKRNFRVFEKQYQDLHTSIENFVDNNDFKRIAAVSEESRKERQSLIRILKMTDEKYAGTEETAYALIEGVSGYLPGPSPRQSSALKRLRPKRLLNLQSQKGRTIRAAATTQAWQRKV